MSKYQSTKVIELGSCAFRQWRATHSHCQYLHGYQLKAKLWFGCSELDDKNWSVDFGSLKDLKANLQSLFDHTTTVAQDDPELETFKELDKKGLIQLRVFEGGVGIERVAQAVFELSNDFIKPKTDGRCWVDRVEVFEHEDNSATYTGVHIDPSLLWTEEEILEVISGNTSTETQALEGSDSTADQVDVKVSKPVVVKEKDLPKPTQKGLPDLPGASTKTKGNWFGGTTWG
jgi:6-pyruvoyltetrahydropterin/6-carboxytetrahydropterin synthase